MIPVVCSYLLPQMSEVCFPLPHFFHAIIIIILILILIIIIIIICACLFSCWIPSTALHSLCYPFSFLWQIVSLTLLGISIGFADHAELQGILPGIVGPGRLEEGPRSRETLLSKLSPKCRMVSDINLHQIFQDLNQPFAVLILANFIERWAPAPPPPLPPPPKPLSSSLRRLVLLLLPPSRSARLPLLLTRLPLPPRLPLLPHLPARLLPRLTLPPRTPAGSPVATPAVAYPGAYRRACRPTRRLACS